MLCKRDLQPLLQHTSHWARWINLSPPPTWTSVQLHNWVASIATTQLWKVQARWSFYRVLTFGSICGVHLSSERFAVKKMLGISPQIMDVLIRMIEINVLSSWWETMEKVSQQSSKSVWLFLILIRNLTGSSGSKDHPRVNPSKVHSIPLVLTLLHCHHWEKSLLRFWMILGLITCYNPLT